MFAEVELAARTGVSVAWMDYLLVGKVALVIEEAGLEAFGDWLPIAEVGLVAVGSCLLPASKGAEPLGAV